MNLLERVEHSIRERTLFRRGEKVLVAVSGGLDSMVLLHALAVLAKSQGCKPVVAHYNHQLRGRSSDADERLVKVAAAKLGLVFHVGRGDVKTHSRKNGVSIEMAARELRHAFLAKVARQAGCRVIALAHHADDQVELFFLRLLRGAGGEGLGGMKWETHSPVDHKLTLIRPLLDVGKNALNEFAKQTGITFREDSSNRSADILRNRVRLELLPLLRQKFHPAIDKSVARVMEIVRAEAEAVSALAEGWLGKKSTAGAFKDCSVAVQRRIIQLQLHQLGVAADFELIESLRIQSGKKISISSQVWLEADASGRVKKSLPSIQAFKAEDAFVRLGKSKGKSQFSSVTLSWEFGVGENFDHRQRIPGVEMFDADKIGGKIVLRHWHAGDRFQPIGMKSAVKLQDWFTNLKIPAVRRRELIVATTERGEVFWVEGLRIGEKFKLVETTRQRLIWRWFRQ